MNEYVEALVHLREQLAHAGVCSATSRTALAAYAIALTHRNESQWRTFYRSIYFALEELAERPLRFVGSAALPLLALLDDDLGSQVIDPARRARIRQRLVEYEYGEASLSS